MSRWDPLYEQIEDLLLEKLGIKIEPWEAQELSEEIVELVQSIISDAFTG